MLTLRLAIDWTPNINHVGFFIAKTLGYYEKLGIQLEILNPIDDHYQVTPGKKLELGLADFVIAPFETVISLNNKANRVDAVAVFAILQNDLSCIVTLQESNLDAPRKLDHQIYASYKARYEDAIVQQMVVNDGGAGEIKIIYPEKLGIWNTLLEGKAASTWIFDNWEGVEADSKNIQLNKFVMRDYGIPYGYSPVVLTKKTGIEKHKELYANFIKATVEGFLFAKNNPAESIGILQHYLTEYDLKNIDLKKSLAMTVDHFGDDSSCGQFEPERVASFLKWIVERKLEDPVILNQQLYTNELFK